MNNEIELKLSLPESMLPKLREHPIIKNAELVKDAMPLLNTYYDTDNLSLYKKKIGLRIRNQAEQLLQTVKCAGVTNAGILSRPEWEYPFQEKFDFSQIDNPDVRKLLEQSESKLQAVFVTKYQRKVYRYRPNDKTSIFLMLDQGSISYQDKSVPICELELELESGLPESLFDLAHELNQEIHFFPCYLSKAQTGYRLVTNDMGHPVYAEKCDLATNMTPFSSFLKLAFACIRQWQGNIDGLSISDKKDFPEFIHQLRVSQRRLRSLLKLYTPVLPIEFVVKWRDKLRTNANTFGEGRDLDVLVSEILIPVKTFDDKWKASLEGLRELIDKRRAQAYLNAEVAYDVFAQGQLIIALSTELHHLDPSDVDDLIPLDLFMHRQIFRLHDKVLRKLKRAKMTNIESLHDLRIAVKNLRYGLDFFEDLFVKNEFDNHIKKTKQVQDHLGHLHDIDVAQNILTSLSARSKNLSSAVAYILGWHACAIDDAQKRLPQILKSLKNLDISIKT